MVEDERIKLSTEAYKATVLSTIPIPQIFIQLHICRNRTCQPSKIARLWIHYICMRGAFMCRCIRTIQIRTVDIGCLMHPATD